MHTSASRLSNSHRIPQGWTAADMPVLTGYTALVTGANAGLGFLTSLRLAQQGAQVIMAVRDLLKGQDAAKRIKAVHPSANLDVRQLDLADLRQVNRFATDLLVEGTPIHMLINNAGIMMPPHSLTPQGHELQFGVNHLAHFALTGLLMPRILQSQGHIVTVSSDLHKRGSIHFDDLAGNRHYGRMAFYAQSKFANVLFGLELDRRLRAAHALVKSVLAHPGYAATNLQLSATDGVLKLFMRIGNRFLAQPAEIGVLPQLFAATAESVESGDFIGPDGPYEKRGYPTLVQPIARARDPQLAKRLWQLSEELTGVEFVINE